MITEIKEAIEDLQEDFSVPKNVKEKLSLISTILSNPDSLQMNKVMDALDEISNDINLQPYVRSQIWNLTTMMESAKSSVEILK